jgi:site-specific recombinase XerD
MKTALKLLFFVKRSEVKSDGTCPIMGRISVDKTVAQFGTKLTVPVSLWDTRANRVTGKSNIAVETNRSLDAISLAIHQHYNRLMELRNKVSAVDVKNAFQGIASAQETLVRFFIKHNETFSQRVGVNRTKGTLRSYRTSLHSLVSFIERKYKVPDIPFTKLDMAFIESFTFYLQVERKNGSKCLQLKLRHLRKMVRLAVYDGIISRDPFNGFKADVPPETTKQRYLTHQEIGRLLVTPMDTADRCLIRDMFLFSLFTGIAYIDMCNLTPEHITEAEDGSLWLRSARQKTREAYEVPLLKLPQEIIRRYKDVAPEGKLLPMPRNCATNRNLKIIAKLCGIERNLTFHMARHSYATEICLSQGVSMESVGRLLGHRDMRSTQHYAKATNEKIAADVKQAEVRIGSLFRLSQI